MITTRRNRQLTENNKLANKIKIGAKSGLHARIDQAQILKEAQKTAITTMPNRLVVIADFSGSMDGYEPCDKSKLTLLKEGLQDFALKSDPNDTAIAVQSFPDGFVIDLTNDSQEIFM